MPTPLPVDTFSARCDELIAAGWTFTNYQRYDPTNLDGITPSGKTVTIRMSNNSVVITVAGNSRTLTRAKSQWLDPNLCKQAILDAYALLPAGQR